MLITLYCIVLLYIITFPTFDFPDLNSCWVRNAEKRTFFPVQSVGWLRSRVHAGHSVRKIGLAHIFLFIVSILHHSSTSLSASLFLFSLSVGLSQHSWNFFFICPQLITGCSKFLNTQQTSSAGAEDKFKNCSLNLNSGTCFSAHKQLWSTDCSCINHISTLTNVRR